MKKWEYKRVDFMDDDFEDRNNRVAALGREGWEMVGFFIENLNPPEADYSGWETFWFKREIEATEGK